MSEAEGDGKTAMRRLGVREFRANMADILRQARHGSSFLVTSRDEVLAEIHPPSKAPVARRQPGALRGRIRMAGDFDELPPDLLAVMEGERA